MRVYSSFCEKGAISEEGNSTYKGLNLLDAFGPGRLEFECQVSQLSIALARVDTKSKNLVTLQICSDNRCLHSERRFARFLLLVFSETIIRFEYIGKERVVSNKKTRKNRDIKKLIVSRSLLNK